MNRHFANASNAPEKICLCDTLRLPTRHGTSIGVNPVALLIAPSPSVTSWTLDLAKQYPKYLRSRKSSLFSGSSKNAGSSPVKMLLRGEPPAASTSSAPDWDSRGKIRIALSAKAFSDAERLCRVAASRDPRKQLPIEATTVVFGRILESSRCRPVQLATPSAAVRA